LSRETYSRNPINYSEGMADDQKDRFIQYLAEQHQEDELTKRAMELVLEDFMAEMKELKNQMASMQSKQSDLENQLSEERKLRKSAERKTKSLREKLDYARQEKFGDRRQRVMKKDKSGKPAPSEPDRQDEQDGYDGTDDTLRTDSVDKNESRNEPARPQKERDLSNRPDGYKTMGVSGESIEHPSDLTKVPGRIIERRMVRVLKSVALEKDSIVNCDETWCKVRKYDHYKKCYIWVLVNKAQKKSAQFKDTVHQVCMSHAKNKFVKASNQGGEPTAERFSNILKEFFMKERKCDEAGLTPEERLRERQSLETKELLIELRSLLDSELSKDSEFRSQYYTEALNYLNRFWKEIFAYLDDGELPIDNNLAERTIRKLTTQRNNSLHYGSDAGAEMAATYHSVIGTVKLHGSSVWNFIGTFFKNIFNGCRDYVNMVPDKITLAIGQC
jgi:transposase